MKRALGEEGTEQFTVTTFVADKHIGEQKIHDPFVNTTVTIGWPDLLRGLLRRRLKVRISVRGSHAATRRIMTLDPVELQRENELIDSRAEWTGVDEQAR